MNIASPKLSAASKMPCKSWSLPAWDTCPGARDDNGEPVPACQHCYALQGRYTFGAVKAVRDHNLEDWRSEGWAEAMVKHIGKSKLFRWFDSGDVYDPELAALILYVIRETPNCRHWLPTRAYKDEKILPILRLMQEESNAAVRFSSDSVTGEELTFEEWSSTIIASKEDFVPGKGRVLCTAYKRKGKCGNCRACFDRRINVVSYIQHGNKVKADKFMSALV